MKMDALFNHSELAFAAYADLSIGPVSTDTQRSALEDGGQGMSPSQATSFSKRYTEVVEVSPDSGTGYLYSKSNI